MKTLISKTLIILLVSGILGVFIQGCCEENYRITPKSDMYAVVSVNYPLVKLDTISSAFLLETKFIQDISELKQSFNFINGAYATTCATKYVNYFNTESFTLTIDKPFVYNGDTISNTENLLELDELNHLFSNEFGSVEVFFNQTFMFHSLFQKETYKFKITGSTTDGVLLADSLELYFDL